MSWQEETRFDRALGQRMYLLGAERQGEREWTFTIEGSRGIPYRIYMNASKSTCTCPDFMRRRSTCKHIIFVSTRVLRMSTYSAIITSSMDQSLSSLLLQSKEASEKEATDALLEPNEEGGDEPAKKLDGSCPICFDDFESSDESKCEWCSTCKNPIHKACLGIWLRQKQNCPLCRARWIRPVAVSAATIAGSTGDDALLKFASRPTAATSSSSSAASPVRLVLTPYDDDHPMVSSHERMPVTAIKQQYKVDDVDLAGLNCEYATNPRYPGGPSMRLYRIRDVETIAVRNRDRRLQLAAQQKEAARKAKLESRDRAKQAAKAAREQQKQLDREAKKKAKDEEREAKRKAKEQAKREAREAALETKREVKETAPEAKRKLKDESQEDVTRSRETAETISKVDNQEEDTSGPRRSKRRRTTK